MWVIVICVVALAFVTKTQSTPLPLAPIPPSTDVYDSTWAVHYVGEIHSSDFESLGFEVIANLTNIINKNNNIINNNNNNNNKKKNAILLRHRETHARYHLHSSEAHLSSPSVTHSLASLPHVLWAAQQVKVELFTRVALPTDPLFTSQWHLLNTGQFGGVISVDVNIQGAWDKGFTGTGVQIAIVDDGYQYTHPDLAPGYMAAYSFNFNDGTSDPSPNVTVDFHGTAAAGVALASKNNNMCGVGAAYNASGSGLRLLHEPVTDATQAVTLTYMYQFNMIYSNSWGPKDDGISVGKPGPLVQASMQDAVINGRDGLGSVYVWAAGNGGLNNDNCNYDGFANSRFVTAVGALAINGKKADYSEPCAALIVVAPSSNGINATQGIRTVDLMGVNGYTTGDCTINFGGTSSACPLVSGIVALMLQANAALGWRDVPFILASTARKIDPTDSDWVTNAAGYHVNHKYGFGLVDATAAVLASQSYNNLPVEQSTKSYVTTSATSIRDYPDPGIQLSFPISDDIVVERVLLTVSIDHPASGDLAVSVTSPSGTVSTLATPHATLAVIGLHDKYYAVGTAKFGAALTVTGVTATLVYSTPLSGCGTITNCNALQSAIAFVSADGSCSFTARCKAVQQCGAVGCALYSNDPLLGDDILSVPGTDPSVVIPVVYIPYNLAHSGLAQSVVFLGLQKYAANSYASGWTFSSTRLLGESSKGTWTMRVYDGLPSDTGIFYNASLSIYGHVKVPGTSTTSPASTSNSPVTTSTSSSTSSSSSSTTGSQNGTVRLKEPFLAVVVALCIMLLVW